MAPPTPAPKAPEKSFTLTSSGAKGAEGVLPQTVEGEGGGGGAGASEGQGPQRQPQRRLNKRLVEVIKAVGGSYCRLQLPLKRCLSAWRQGDNGWA